MATVNRYSTAAGTRWRVRYRTPDHRQTDKRGFKTKRDADAFAATGEVKKLTVTPHDLRHTAASLAVSAGINVLALARMLGHKTPA